MEKYTDLEIEILTILAKEHYEGEWMTEDWEEISPHLDTWILTTDGLKQKNSTIFQINNLDPKVYRGVISSLIKKDAILTDEYEASASWKDILNGLPHFATMVTIGISKGAYYDMKKMGKI